MEKSLVVVRNQELRVGTWDLAKGFDTEHRFILRLIDKYKNRLEKFGKVEFEKTTLLPFKGKKGVNSNEEKRGAPIKEVYLNEAQIYQIGTYLKNVERVLDFKDKLVAAFMKAKMAFAISGINRHNQEWLEARSKGIQVRREETDVIKEFIEYAKSQGSQSADKYYMIISKMQNQALFLLDQKFPNLRNVLNFKQLNLVQTADQIVSRYLKLGMEKQMNYKEIYILARDKVIAYAEIVGKTSVPKLLENKIPEIVQQSLPLLEMATA